MSPQSPQEWNELSALWRDKSAAFSAADIEAHQRRTRRQLFIATAVELVAAALGVAAALWLAFAAPFRWMGLVTTCFAVLSATVMLRARHAMAPAGTARLLESLKESMAHEDWLAEQLRLGRALAFVALFAIVMAGSVQLLHIHSASRYGLLATAAAGLAAAAVLTWNLLLTWRVRKRHAWLKAVAERLER